MIAKLFPSSRIAIAWLYTLVVSGLGLIAIAAVTFLSHYHVRILAIANGFSYHFQFD